MKNGSVGIIVLVLLGFLSARVGVCAENFTEEQAIQAAQEGLKKSAKFPWYDPSRDDLRDVRAYERSTDDSETRKEGWQATATPTKTAKAPVAVTGTPWTFGSWFTGSMQTLAVTLLVALLVVLIVISIRYFMLEEEFSLPGAGQIKLAANEEEQQSRRVENLPFQAPVEKGDHLSEARRLYDAGKFQEAIIYLYAYELMQLDRYQVIHLTKGKTNRQYLREVAGDSALRNIVELTMIAFEDVFFGEHELPRERFEACWRQLDEFHRRVQQPLDVRSPRSDTIAQGALA